jgi:hypothetical protein
VGLSAAQPANSPGSAGAAGGPPALMDDDIIGVIKIKDGLFICDEFGAQVRYFQFTFNESFNDHFKFELN